MLVILPFTVLLPRGDVFEVLTAVRLVPVVRGVFTAEARTAAREASGTAASTALALEGVADGRQVGLRDTSINLFGGLLERARRRVGIAEGDESKTARFLGDTIGDDSRFYDFAVL